jgi:hypothetical protein
MSNDYAECFSSNRSGSMVSIAPFNASLVAANYYQVNLKMVLFWSVAVR